MVGKQDLQSTPSFTHGGHRLMQKVIIFRHSQGARTDAKGDHFSSLTGGVQNDLGAQTELMMEKRDVTHEGSE